VGLSSIVGLSPGDDGLSSTGGGVSRAGADGLVDAAGDVHAAIAPTRASAIRILLIIWGVLRYARRTSAGEVGVAAHRATGGR
jgi:hypothetical protein